MTTEKVDTVSGKAVVEEKEKMKIKLDYGVYDVATKQQEELVKTKPADRDSDAVT